MNTFSRVVFWLACVCGLPQTLRAETDLRYRFTVEPGRIHVEADLPTSPHTDQVLLLPSATSRGSGISSAVKHLRLAAGAGELLPGAGDHMLLRGAGGARVTLAYDLEEDWQPALRHPAEHRIILAPSFWEFTGANALLSPALGLSDTVHASFQFLGLQPGETLAGSFGASTEQSFTGAWSEVRNALFAGGRLRRETLLVDGSALTIAITADTLRLKPAEVAVKAREILRAERRFWREGTGVPFTVVLAPYLGELRGGAGSSYTGAAALFLAPGQSFDRAAESLLAHEIFHAWNPGALGTGYDLDEVGWFVEGFTRFYEGVVLRRAGLASRAEYLHAVNDTIREYVLSPHAVSSPQPYLSGADPRPALGDKPLDDDELYARGALIALWLNDRMERESGHSVDDLLFALREHPADRLAPERIFAATARFLDAGTVAELRRLASGQEPVPVLPGSLGRCVALRSQHAASFDLGFWISSLQHDGTVTGVKPDSNAWRAGVRDGQHIVGWSVSTRHPERVAILATMAADGHQRDLVYAPRGPEREVPEAFELPGCTDSAWLPADGLEGNRAAVR